MSLYVVDIHGDIEGDYEIVRKYEEQEPCEDCISRQAVLDLIEHYNSDGLGSVFYGYDEGLKFANAVNELPSVTPTQEPILDKIRAEIIELRSKQNVGVLECLDIIDKYKESEE